MEQQLGEWEKMFDPRCLRRLASPGCRFYLYSQRCDGTLPVEFNQKSWQRSDEILLWVGPRIDLTDERLLRTPASNDLGELAAEMGSGPDALDTAVCVRYRSNPHALIVKTDVLNGTFVYWTRFGRWTLLSNSSLTLARLTRGSVDWFAASEFLASGSIYGNHSLYKDIRSLKPATVYGFTRNAAPAAHSYWDLDRLSFNTLSAKEACSRIVENLDKDFSDLNATGKTFILDLTGGYDSRTNLGFALRKLKNFQTTVSGAAGDEDVRISNALARHFGFTHTVIPFTVDDEVRHAQRLADSVFLTDLEYDIVEYSRIYKAQTQFDTLRQPSIHGSGGGDIARNIILRSEFCTPSPDGKVVLEPLIAQRFRCAIPASLSRPDLPIADWPNHMRARISEYDVPALPAFARLDILYLRMRMQFWQARISSSTNRFRSSFSTWTNRRVMETMLITRWREKQHQMLSRLFLQALHPDLTRFVVARGEPGGPTLWSAALAAPARLQYYAGRLAARFGWPPTNSHVNTDAYKHFVLQSEEIVTNILRPEAIRELTAPGGLINDPRVLGRLVTLAHVKASLESRRVV